MTDKAVVMFRIGRGEPVDLEIPLDITAEELIRALNTAYGLGIGPDQLLESYLKAENPIALIRGSKTLRALGIHDGTTMHFET